MFTLEHLHFAWLQVRAGSKTAGVDGISVDLFESMATEQLRNIEYQLHQESYTASPAKGFYIPKKNGSKRLIGIPTVCSYCTLIQGSLGQGAGGREQGEKRKGERGKELTLQNPR